jgi:hypothetical protein
MPRKPAVAARFCRDTKIAPGVSSGALSFVVEKGRQREKITPPRRACAAPQTQNAFNTLHGLPGLI